MYRDIVTAPEKITKNGKEWWYQEFNHWDGTLEAIRLYDEEGNFVNEFQSYDDIMDYIREKK